MRKSYLLLFSALLFFWLAMSSDVDFEHLVAGVILALFMAWYWRELADIITAQTLRLSTVLCFFQYLALLAWEIVLSNLAVVGNILFNKPALEPGFIHFHPPLKTTWGRVLLANSITLTPGTVTIDLNPDTGEFMVHGLTKAMRDGVVSGRLIWAIQKLESTKGWSTQ